MRAWEAEPTGAWRLEACGSCRGFASDPSAFPKSARETEPREGLYIDPWVTGACEAFGGLPVSEDTPACPSFLADE